MCISYGAPDTLLKMENFYSCSNAVFGEDMLLGNMKASIRTPSQWSDFKRTLYREGNQNQTNA